MHCPNRALALPGRFFSVQSLAGTVRTLDWSAEFEQSAGQPVMGTPNGGLADCRSEVQLAEGSHVFRTARVT